MLLVEKHSISINHKYYDECDELAFKSKNLYNACNYLIRQNYFNYQKLSGQTVFIITDGKLNQKFSYQHFYDSIIFSGQTSNKKFLNYIIIDKIFNRINNTDYRSLPTKIAKQVLIQVNTDWSSYFEALKDYKINPSKYNGMPKIPQYKDPLQGRNIVKYELNAINGKNKKLFKLSNTNIFIKFKNHRNGLLKQIRIVPKLSSYNIEIVYEIPDVPLNTETNKINAIGIDLGIKNLCTIANNFNEKPILINGGSIKSINRYSNKLLGKAQKLLPKNKNKENIHTSYKIKNIHQKRKNILDTEFHNISKYIIDYCLKFNVKLIVIGYNKGWKQKVNMGTKTNQSFVNIPFSDLISKISYKAQMLGINIKLVDESYTSKCSFFDDEETCFHLNYLGKRIKRGLFETKNGFKLNADINAAYNILKKVVGDFKADIGQAVSPSKKNVSFSL